MKPRSVLGIRIASKDVLYLVSAVLLSALFKYYMSTHLLLSGLETQAVFVAGLFGRFLETPWVLIYIADFGNILLVWFITTLLFGTRPGRISPLIYAVSPISIYSSLSGNGFVVILFLIMLIVAGMVVSFDRGKKVGVIITIVGIIVFAYYSFWGILALPVWIVALFLGKNKQVLSSKAIALTLAALLSPLIILSLLNTPALINEYFRNITLFSDPGLINAVNVNRGQAQEAGYLLISRLVDNKYTYLGRHLLFNTIDHLSPVIYFTPQLKMLGFSFSPPILLGFIVPLVLGLPLLIRKLTLTRYLIPVVLFFFVPSILSWPSPNIDSLILVLPFIVLATSVGVVKGIESNKRHVKTITALSLVFVLVQLIVVLVDISTREPVRLMGFMQ